MPTFKDYTDFFQRVGANAVNHSSKTYLAHAIGVYNDLKEWGCSDEVARVGVFHSIYGTQLFQGFTLPLERRGEVRELIGERAERLTWLHCALDRPHFDEQVLKPTGPYELLNRFNNELVPVSDEDFHDLCVVHLCDWIEQVARWGQWDYRRTAYRQLAERLGGLPLARYEETFADAPAQEWFNEYETRPEKTAGT